jgi:hypothetical protein
MTTADKSAPRKPPTLNPGTKKLTKSKTKAETTNLIIAPSIGPTSFSLQITDLWSPGEKNLCRKKEKFSTDACINRPKRVN